MSSRASRLYSTVAGVEVSRVEAQPLHSGIRGEMKVSVVNWQDDCAPELGSGILYHLLQLFLRISQRELRPPCRSGTGLSSQLKLNTPSLLPLRISTASRKSLRASRIMSATAADLGPSRKYRASCDRCHASKIKCSGGYPRCKRCAHSSLSCLYSPARRIGKPLGSKNKKTLEKLRRQREERSMVGSHEGHDAAFISACTKPDHQDRWGQSDGCLCPLETTALDVAQLPSPPTTSPDLSTEAQATPSPEASLAGHTGSALPIGCHNSLFTSLNLDFFDLSPAQQLSSWPDTPDVCSWNASTFAAAHD